MINIDNVKKAFNNYLDKYDNKNDASFKLKVTHTYNVVANAELIASNMGLSKEDINLAKLIAYLHDIGKFEELKIFNGFNSTSYNHASFGSKVLFEDGLIRDFIDDDSYDNIIKKSIENHNKLKIEDGLSDRELLHSRIIRDADKLDNFRVNVDESIETRFPNKFKSINEFNNSLISNNVYKAILNHECVNIYDRVYPLDYWLCVLAFIFDLNFKETLNIVKEKNYVNILIDKFNYKNENIMNKMEKIRTTLNEYINIKTCD